MNRRSFLAAGAGALAASAATQPKVRSKMGMGTAAFHLRRPDDALEFLEYCHSIGAGGIQSGAKLEPSYLKNLRSRAEQRGMYIELSGRLPDQDTSGFEALCKASKEVGADAIRAVCLGGRRYENFSSLKEWKAFEKEARAKVARAVPIAEKHKVKLALENHKDWTLDEMQSLLRQYPTEYFGCTLDCGNNVAMLDDPMQVIRELAPRAHSVHLKDIAVKPYEDGFLMADLPFGEGLLPLKEVVQIIRSHQPKINFICETMTRDPLQVPVFTDKYWATWPNRPATYLANTLRMVREHESKQPLPQVSSLEKKAQLALEEKHNILCLEYAARHLNL